MRKFRGLLLLALLLPLLAVAEGGMTLEQIAKLQQVGQAVVSPDGERIAYTRIVPRLPGVGEDGPAWVELHVIGRNGQSRGFITGEVNVSQIGWTPDSSAITFVAQRGSDTQPTLYRIPVAGGEAERLLTVGTGVANYSFAPDGRRVALVGMEALDADARALYDQGFNAIIFEEDWRPRRLWIAELDSKEIQMLDIAGSVQRVQWSPAGDRLAIVVAPRQLADDILMLQRIRIIRPDGREIGRIENPGKLGASAWSPNGTHFAFIATDKIEDTRAGRLMVARRDGGDFTNLLPDLLGHIWHLDWRAPGEIVFISHEGVEARVGQIAVTGRGHNTLYERSGLIFDSISVADNGRMVFTAHTPEHPREVYAPSPRTLEMERLTDSNPWLAAVRMARQQVVRYPAADGLEIEALLMWPLDYVQGELYPLIVAAHGGPEAHFSNGWLTSYKLPGQHAAAQGYFMLYPNYRGSTGRGVEFALSSQGRPAKEEFSDLVDAVDWMIEQGLADPDRVGMTGGDAAAWATTYYSERFAAVVMNVGISDPVSMLGTSDIPRQLYRVRYLSWPWENWDLFRQASPIYHVKNARTPILILHGDADPRVDPTQSRILYRFLMLQHKPPPVRLVLYRGEGHGKQRAATRWDFSLRLMRWMDHYLKGEGGDPPPHQLDYRLDVFSGN